jgi:hypothetical protein
VGRKRSTRPTYTRYSSNATWHFWYVLSPEQRARLNDPTERAPWVAEQLQVVLSTLQDFSYPRRIVVEWGIREPDYELLAPITEPKLKRLERFLRSTKDVRRIFLPTTLRCVQVAEDGELEPVELEEDGEISLSIELNEDSTFEAAPDVVRLLFNLWADIYAPISAGQEEDNHELAALNGSRLEGFLRRLQAALPLLLYEFEPMDPWDRGEVDRFGYKLPHERRDETTLPLSAAWLRETQRSKDQQGS